jgi:hypothetical protein
MVVKHMGFLMDPFLFEKIKILEREIGRKKR